MIERLSLTESEKEKILEETRAKKLSVLRLVNYVGRLLKSENEADREKGKFLRDYLENHRWHLENH